VGDYISRNRLGTTAGGAAPGAPVYNPIGVNPQNQPVGFQSNILNLSGL
jgi:hypothetical protein